MPSGGALASAVLGITDAIPFYDIGSVVQRISNVCGELSGCTFEEMWGDEDDAAGSTDQSFPSEGTQFAGAATGDGRLESEVELVIGRNFGLPAAKSLMTTTCALRELPRPGGSESAGMGGGMGGAGGVAGDAAGVVAPTGGGGAAADDAPPPPPPPPDDEPPPPPPE